MARKIGPKLLPVRMKTPLFLSERGQTSESIARIGQALMTELYRFMPAVDLSTDHTFRTGGYAVIMNLADGSYYQFPVGILQPGKLEKYMKFSMEKARRLRCRVLGAHPNEFSSWQSRDEAKERWGGSIITGRRRDRPSSRWIFSFSGLPQLADEAFSLAFAVYLRKMTGETAMNIADFSENRYLPAMLKAMDVYDSVVRVKRFPA